MTHPLFSTTNTLKWRLMQGETVYGIFSYTGNSEIAEAAAVTGIDFIIIDMEASPMTPRDSVHVLQSLNGSTCSGLVRVPRHDQQLIGHALDIGACGVMIPKVENHQEAHITSSALRYPPNGTRGINAFRAEAYGANEDSYMQNSDKDCLAVVQIESPEAVTEIQGIVSNKNVDVAFIGMGDLTLSSGVYGEIDHPTIVHARQQVLNACAEHSKVPGIFAGSAKLANKFAREGFKFIVIGNDLKHFKNGLSTMLDQIK